MNEEFIQAMRLVLQAARYGSCIYIERAKNEEIAQAISKVTAFTDAAEQVHLEKQIPVNSQFESDSLVTSFTTICKICGKDLASHFAGAYCLPESKRSIRGAR